MANKLTSEYAITSVSLFSSLLPCLCPAGARYQIGAVQRTATFAALAQHLRILWQSTDISEVGAALAAPLGPAHAALSGQLPADQREGL